MSTLREMQTALFAKRPGKLFAAVRRMVESDEAYRVAEVDDEELALTVVRRAPDLGSECTLQLGVGVTDDGAILVITPHEAPEVSRSRSERRATRAAVTQLLEEVRCSVDREAEANPQADDRGGRHGGSIRQLLADLTGRRVALAALVLLGAYLVPLLLVRGIAEANEASLLGGTRWLPTTLALAIGVGLVVALTIRFGGWFQAVSFGEDYMLSFRPIAGYALGWWRFVVQVGALILVALTSADIEDGSAAQQISNAETAALPGYAARVPGLPGWEEVSGDLDQNTYDDRPNASYELTYAVPATFGLPEAEDWLSNPGWSSGVDGREPIGDLRDIECSTELETCEAQVTPPAGKPAEYSIALRIDDSFTVALDTGEPGTLLLVEIEYRDRQG